MDKLPLNFAVLQITITPVYQFQLPAYPAITIRGGLGYALRQVLDDDEVYRKLFEELEGETVNEQYIPYTRPFIIRTGYNGKRLFQQGETFTFEILLFGDAVSYYQYFISALNLFGQNGIGKANQPFHVVQIVSLGDKIPRKIFEIGDLFNAPYVISTSDLDGSNFSINNPLELDFITPVRLKLHGENQSEFGLVEVVDSLLRRLESLLYFHHEKYSLNREWKEEVTQSAINSEIHDAHFQYVAYERFSTRQKQKMYIDGVVGNLIVSNLHSADLVKLLYLGQYIHIGKQTAFGLGQYQLYHR